VPSEGELFSLNSHLIDGVAPINSVFLRLKPDLVAEFVRATRFGPDLRGLPGMGDPDREFRPKWGVACLACT